MLVPHAVRFRKVTANSQSGKPKSCSGGNTQLGGQEPVVMFSLAGPYTTVPSLYFCAACLLLYVRLNVTYIVGSLILNS